MDQKLESNVTLGEVFDVILSQEIELIDRGLRPGFIILGANAFRIIMDAILREGMKDILGGLDENCTLDGLLFVIDDLAHKDKIRVAPQGSLRTNSILKRIMV